MMPAAGGPSAPPPAGTLPPGLAEHPDYRITRELGRGGMGVVYLAQNTLMGRTEVLKVMSGQSINRRGMMDRFLTEIRNAARLHHPNVVTAYTALRFGESLVLAMEHVDGLDLSQIVQARGPLPVAHACNYVHQAALGLQHAHESGMVHRDIKPSNLMLARQGNRASIKILDFGLAKVRSEGIEDEGLTHEGQMLGTPHYIAPEQISDARHADIRADIYSLGCTLYYLLGGGPPFQGKGLYDILQAHHSMEAMPLNLARPEVPVELAALVAKMMAKEPDRRFQEPKEVARALTPFFRKGDLAYKGPDAEMSRANRSASGLPVPGVVARASRAISSGAGSIDPRKSEATLSDRNRPTDPQEADRDRGRIPSVSATPRTPWLWRSVGVGALLLALFFAWAVVIRLQTPNGVIELMDLPKDAEVFVDGDPVKVNWPVDGTPAFISVREGKHRIRVKKDGLESHPEELTVPARGRIELTASLVPPATLPAVKVEADDLPDGSEVGEILQTGPATALVDEPPVSDADVPPLSGEAAPPPVLGMTSTRDKFQLLFNGKDLDGWKAHPKQEGNWHVARGALIGSGPAPSHLYTVRDNFTDFHLRVEARFNKGGGGGLYLRCPFGPSLPKDDPKWPEGFEAMINNSRIIRNNTGGIHPGEGNNVYTTGPTPMPFGRWFVMDVIAVGNAVAVLVDGKASGYHVEGRDRLLSRGHIALQQYSPKTEIEFRRIEIRELNLSEEKDSKEIQCTPMGRVSRVAFTPDGLGIISGAFPNEHWIAKGGASWWSGGTGTVRLSEVVGGRNLATMEGQGWPVIALAVSFDGRYAASHGRGWPILIWDLKSGKRIHRLKTKDPTDKPVYTVVAFSPDNRRVMGTMMNGNVLTWDLSTEQEQPPATLDAGPIKKNEFPVATFSPDRRQLITGSRYGAVELWDLPSGKRLQTFAGHQGEVRSVACSADGRFIISGGIDTSVRLWDVSTGKELKLLKRDDEPVTCVAFSPDGKRALSAGVYGRVRLWDLASGEELCRLEGHTMAVNSVAYSPDGRRAVSGSDDRTRRLWQLPE